MKIGIIGMGFVGGTTTKVFEQKHEIFPYDRYKKPYTKNENHKNDAPPHTKVCGLFGARFWDAKEITATI